MMKSYAYHLLLSLAFILCLTTLQAQIHVGLNAFNHKPKGDFKDSGYKGGWGAAVEVSSRDMMPRFFMNFRWGLHLDYTWSGTESLSLGYDPLSYTSTSVSMTNHSVGSHLFGRLITKGKKMRFYMDYFLGLRSIFTTQTFLYSNFDPGYSGEDEIDVGMVTNTVAGYRGWSMGMEYRIAPRLFFDVRMTRAKGTGARYVDLNSIDLNGSQINYEMVQSHDTHSFAWSFGVTWRIGRDRQAKNSKSRKTVQHPAPQKQDPSPSNDGALNKPPLQKY